MQYRNHIFCLTAALLYAVSVSAFNFVVVNNTHDDDRVKIRLKGSDEQPEHDLGMVKADGGIGEKKFEGSEATLCVDYIKVGDLKPEIFEVSDDQYNGIMSRMGNPRDVTAYFQDNRAALKPASPTLGVCSTRRFDVIGNVNNQLIIITKIIP